MDEQGNMSTAMVPLSELGSLNLDQYSDYCVDLWERVEAGDITIDQAADLMFGKEPDFTYTRWSA